MTYSLSRRLAAETLGTALLVAAVVGSGIMADRLTGDGAVALLANTAATAAALAVLIAVLAPISGAHLNPAVSLVALLARQLSMREAGAYVALQIVGGITGTILAHAMFAEPLLQASTQTRAGTPLLLSEAIATFGLLTLILFGSRQRLTNLPFLVGLYIAAAYWFTSSTSFANPAVTIARTLSNTFSGISPVDAPAFIVAQVIGALLAFAFANWMLGRPARS